jgi:hypothetical protein
MEKLEVTLAELLGRKECESGVGLHAVCDIITAAVGTFQHTTITYISGTNS